MGDWCSGLSLSVASTVVLLRAITDRGELDTSQGRIAIGWLIVEDLVTIVILVLLPTIAPLIGGTAEAPTDALGTLGNIALALGKAALFVVVMVVAGTRLVPRLLTLVSNEGSKELFTLAVLAIAIGFAFLSSTVFGVSFALGAFLAGAVVGESDMSHQAAADALPLRDAFAVLFFVSVGMLLDPSILIEMPLAIVAVVFLVVFAKAIVKFAIVALFGYPVRVALTVGAGFAQIGEFSFIVGTVGLSLGLLPPEGFQLIVAGALLSIALNPVLFHYVDPLEARLRTNSLMTRLLGWRAGDLAHLRTDRGRRAVAAARHPVRLRPGRTAGRPGARPARLHVRRDQPAARPRSRRSARAASRPCSARRPTSNCSSAPMSSTHGW